MTPGRVRARGSLDHGERLTDDEAEFGVERERAVVVGRLNEPDASGATIALVL
jgi:hypothetical protein